MSTAPRRRRPRSTPPFQAFITEGAWGSVWSRPELDAARALDGHAGAPRRARPVGRGGDARARHRQHRRDARGRARGDAACRGLRRGAARRTTRSRSSRKPTGRWEWNHEAGRREAERARARRVLPARPRAASAGADAGLQDQRHPLAALCAAVAAELALARSPARCSGTTTSGRSTTT